MLNKSFVTLYVDYDSSPDAGRFTTDGVPGNFILDETGNQVFSEAGAYPPDSFISVFQPYAKDPTTPKVLPVPPPIPDKNDELNQDNSDNKDMEKIVSEFDEGGRFQVKNVNIQNKGNVFTTNKGGRVKVSMDIKHDCSFCGNAVNQIIVGLAGEDKAQESVWNGKQRSGGELKIVNNGTSMVALAEDNEDSAEWVKVFFTLKVPSKKGIYYIRTRYAQDYQGKVLTKEGLKKKQPDYPKVLDWWKVDRPNGPDSSSNIGAIVVE
jgi:hypothetical protein